MKRFIFCIAIWLVSASSAHAYEFSYSANGYCSYRGKVTGVYVNQSGLLLVYIEATKAELLACAKQVWGDGVTATSYPDQALAISYSANAEFAKYVHSIATAAMHSGKDIQFQAKAQVWSRLSFDRVWGWQ